MAHNPALEAHEHTEHAEHAAHAGDKFISRVAMSVAAFAVLAAVAGSLDTVEDGRALKATSEAVLAQDRATDSWNEYQADSLKRHLYTLSADSGGARADEYRKTAQAFSDTQKKLKAQAQDREAERDRLLKESAEHESMHYRFTGAATLFEIAIAMSTVAIITRRRWLWLTATAFGVLGLVLLALAGLS